MQGTQTGRASHTCCPGTRGGVAGGAGHTPLTRPCPRAPAVAPGGCEAGARGWRLGTCGAIRGQGVWAWRGGTLARWEALAVSWHCKERDMASGLAPGGHRATPVQAQRLPTWPSEQRVKGGLLELSQGRGPPTLQTPNLDKPCNLRGVGTLSRSTRAPWGRKAGAPDSLPRSFLRTVGWGGRGLRTEQKTTNQKPDTAPAGAIFPKV